MNPRAIVLRTAGTNCDYETKKAFELAGAEADRVHVNRLISDEIDLSAYQIMAFPGGFSYGDDIASGKILANEIKYKLGDQIREFARAGKPIIGICNGFQVLVKMGILPDELEFSQTTTLTYNDSDRFEARWVNLTTSQISNFRSQIKNKANCIWTKDLPGVIQLPVAHGEGKFVTADRSVMQKLEANGQVVLRYVDAKGRPALKYPQNPNGSANSIAGICNRQGNVFGLMPHPERYVFKYQHPSRLRWDREGDFGWGLAMFKNALNFV
ncbi:MAG: phosphoribosylformylglycinamidine synthase I [Endomicrobiales bacterium]|nr:phosphoribosylformylglycinamidine synthase I [Endomicrobiales bacterium]